MARSIEIMFHPPFSGTTAAHMTSSLNALLEKINNSGWIGLKDLETLLKGIPAATFAKFVDYPFLFGDSVADIEVVSIDGKITLNFPSDQDATSRTSLDTIFPLVQKNPGQRNSGVFFLGSASGNQFVVPDYTISKKHAVFTRKRNGTFLKDLQSEFGSYVNGVSFGSREVLLNDGDHLAFGRYQFLFLEPKTCFLLLSGKKEKNELIRKPTHPDVSENQLKEKLNATSAYVAECIEKKECEDLDDKLLTIISFIPFFNSFSLHEKKQIVSFHNRLLLAQPDEMIVREHDESNNFFIILKGKVDVVKEEGQVTLNTLGPGNSFGEIAFLTGTRRSANVIAREPTIMLTIDRDFYENVGIEIREKFKDQIIRQISANIIRQNREIQDLNRDQHLANPRIPRKKAPHSPGDDRHGHKKRIAAFINESPVFAKLTKYQKTGLSVLLDTIESFAAGEVIVKENTLQDGLYFIIEGSVAITVTRRDIVLAVLEAGAIFGEISTIGKKTTSANVIAREQVRTVRITAEDMNVLSIEIREKIKDIILDQILTRQSRQNTTILDSARPPAD
ncbi:MAG: cyclic nucleotide-binding domain-containing protein [Magnetococcales bacterium]|nr:cyclic nucleotide-binding domain-containing protein [Magnetococcales bacterium]